MAGMGVSFLPSGNEGMEGAGGGPGQGPGGAALTPIQRAIQLLSLRLPRIGGLGLFPGAIAPSALLNAPGGAGWPYPGGAPSSFPMPGGAPPMPNGGPPRVVPGEGGPSPASYLPDEPIPGGIRKPTPIRPPSEGQTRFPVPRGPRQPY